MEISELSGLKPTGITWLGFGIQIFLLIVLLSLMILGIRNAVKKTEGTATALWILIILLFPFIGPVIAMTCIKPPNP